MRIFIKRAADVVEVLLLPHKDSGKYSFINLTLGHICPCEFDTIKDAIEDLEKYKDLGKINEYYVL